MVKKILVYWRDIPSQIIVQRGRRREKVLLSARFQKAIDRALDLGVLGTGCAHDQYDGIGHSSEEIAVRNQPDRR